MSDAPEINPSSPRTTVPQKIGFAGGAVAAVTGLLAIAGAIANQGGIAATVPSAHASAPSTSVEPPVTRAEVELSAGRAAKIAAVEVAAEAARWRDAQKVLFELEVRGLNDRIASTNTKLDKVIDILEGETPTRRRRR
jgi:hypothetical protein